VDLMRWSVLCAAALMLATVAALQIHPKTIYAYPIEGVCGEWSLGIPPGHPDCRDVATGSGGLSADDFINSAITIGPEIRGIKDKFLFNGSTFKSTTEFWTDPPCFAGKPYCYNWDPIKQVCMDATIPPKDRPDCEWYKPPTTPSKVNADKPWRDVWKNPEKIADPASRDSFCVCPLYQNHVLNPKDCELAGKKVPGRATCAFDSSCGCKSEEFYPGCGALKDYGTQVEILTVSGEMTNMFSDKGAQDISAATCDILCPGGKVDCPELSEGTPACVCSTRAFEAYEMCKGSHATKCVNGKSVKVDPSSWKSSICSANVRRATIGDASGSASSSPPPPTGSITRFGKKLESPDSCILPPYLDPKADVWRNMYSDGECQTDNQVRSTPVRLDVTKVTVKPLTDKQVAHLKATCPIAEFTKDSVTDLSKHTVAECPYLTARGLFAASPVPDCPTGHKCLFSSVYKHQDNFLYVSKAKPSFAHMMRDPISASAVYQLTSTDACLSASALSSIPTSFTALVVLLTTALLW